MTHEDCARRSKWRRREDREKQIEAEESEGGSRMKMAKKAKKKAAVGRARMLERAARSDEGQLGQSIPQPARRWPSWGGRMSRGVATPAWHPSGGATIAGVLST
ncbi:hypothetical protein KM043_013751 [Ampulex compressa]|nr:hypothetical protein KM043_013751 [Ampulex compressa]